MRYILRKFVEAETALEAINKDLETPVHDCGLKDDDEAGKINTHAVGFQLPDPPEMTDELRRKH
jgi:hypothetical protein